MSRLTAGFRDRARLSTPVVAVERGSDGVVVRDLHGGVDRFDHVVFATHADTALSILGASATPSERSVLSAFRFQMNEAVLHRDPTLMPRRRAAWSSWNYLADGRGDAGSNETRLAHLLDEPTAGPPDPSGRSS